MKISILLPYKENFSPIYAGAVSLFINDTVQISNFKKNINIYGNTDYKNVFNLNYVNIPLKKRFLQSQSKRYVEEFIKLENKRCSDLIEIHNRPNYINLIKKNTKAQLVLYFHNDPLSMVGSKTVNERLELLYICSKVIFNSEWSKSRFISGLNKLIQSSEKLSVIQQSANIKKNVNLRKKQKIITFVGKLNSAKGYDIFGKTVIKILNKYEKWKAIVIGDEHREKIFFKHKNLKILGFLEHKKVLKIFENTSIAVACSRWEEPFGRTGLEASSRGCAVIISNRGGLPETITNGIILRTLNTKTLYSAIENLIKKPKFRRELQKLSLKNFYLTHKHISKKIDQYRKNINFTDKMNLIFKPEKKLKILHITNFNERHNGRLFYNTGRRINNGFIRLNHSVLEFSDRDIVSYYRSINDLKGSKKLNKKLIEVVSNYLPDLIVLGHADLINVDTLFYIKQIYPNIRISQWFLDRMDSEWIINRKRFEDKFQITDANFCTTSPDILKFKSNNIFYLPNPVDSSFEKLKIDQKKSFNRDLFFAMSHGVHRGNLKKGKFDVRENFIKKLMNKTPSVKYDIYGMDNKQPIWADNYIKTISQSKMALNLSQGNPVKYYSSDRISQMVGNGLLTFVDVRTRLNDLFTDKELIFYKGIDDLADKINRINKDDKKRMRIARNGRVKYFKYFNSTIIADYIIKKTFRYNTKNFFWDFLNE